MKKRIFVGILLFLITAVSCTKTTLEEGTVENPVIETTIEIQNSIFDNCATISTVNINGQEYYYIMENNLVKYRFVPIDKKSSIVDKSNKFSIYILLFIAFLIGIILGIFLSD
jgi:hypothetical protein